MYDYTKEPARTRVSHYLRTGRILPAEHFGNQKSDKSVYGEDNALSHKSWNTIDFVKHYFTGNGKPINLANVGLLDRFRNSVSVRRAVDDFRNRQIRLAKQKAVEVCHKLKRTNATKTQVTFSDRNNSATDVTLDIFRLFSVGDSTFFRSAQNIVKVDCVKKTLQLETVTLFEIKDWFKDPGDIFDSTDDESEILGGQRYPIIANWSEDIHLERSF